MAKNPKKPKTRASVPPKGPRQAVDPEDTNGLTPVWSLAIFDADGPWGRSCCEAGNATWETIYPHLRDYERMRWGEIYRDKDKNHSVSVERLIREARDRLVALKLDDYDELFRFRLTGTQRVWGIREGRVFKLLWWDRDHEICPSTLRNT